MEIKDYTKAAFFAVTDPSIITVDFAELDKKQKEIIKARDAQPVRSDGPQEELRKLRNQLFLLTERSKSTETYANIQADNVKLLESNLATLLKQKTAAVAAGNDLAVRNHEHAIARLEDERDSALHEFNRARKVSAEAANALKHWPHRERVAELEKSLSVAKTITTE